MLWRRSHFATSRFTVIIFLMKFFYPLSFFDLLLLPAAHYSPSLHLDCILHCKTGTKECVFCAWVHLWGGKAPPEPRKISESKVSVTGRYSIKCSSVLILSKPSENLDMQISSINTEMSQLKYGVFLGVLLPCFSFLYIEPGLTT